MLINLPSDRHCAWKPGGPPNPRSAYTLHASVRLLRRALYYTSISRSITFRTGRSSVQLLQRMVQGE